MKRIAFTMKLFRGYAEEYKKRHDATWPELTALLKQAGIKEYSIFLDETTHTLFGYLTIENPANINELREQPVMQKWWQYMKDIMETKEDDSPTTVELKEVFYMP